MTNQSEWDICGGRICIKVELLLANDEYYWYSKSSGGEENILDVLSLLDVGQD